MNIQPLQLWVNRITTCVLHPKNQGLPHISLNFVVELFFFMQSNEKYNARPMKDEFFISWPFQVSSVFDQIANTKRCIGFFYIESSQKLRLENN